MLAHAKAAGAEDAIVSLRNSNQQHARFADNRITTSGQAEDLQITTTVWVGRKRGTSIGNDSGADALKQLADEAVQIARVSPVHREYVPTLGPQTYPEHRGYAAATANIDLEARAKTLNGVLATCRTAKVTGAGFHTRERSRDGRGDRQRQSPLFPLDQRRLQRDGPRRGRHWIGVLLVAITSICRS